MKYYDVEALERQIREAFAAEIAAADAAIAAGKADAAFVRAQRQFDEVSVQFTLGEARAYNIGTPDEMIAAAAGVAIGGLLASFTAAQPAHGPTLFRWMFKTYRDLLTGDGQGQAPVAKTRLRFKPVRGGHA